MNSMNSVAELLRIKMDKPFYVYDPVARITYPDKCYLREDGISIPIPARFGSVGKDTSKILCALLAGVFEARLVGAPNWVSEGDRVFDIGGTMTRTEQDRRLEWYEFSRVDERNKWMRYFSIKRRLAMAAAEFNSTVIDWADEDQSKFYICVSVRDYNDVKLDIRCDDAICDEHIYFDTMTAAEKAIKIVGEEDLIWMMRDFQSEVDKILKRKSIS